MQTKNSCQEFTPPWVLRWRTDGDARLRLAVAENLNQGHPIDRTYDLPSYPVNGRAVTDQHAMRRNVIPTVAAHLNGLAEIHPREKVVAHVGNGNLMANAHFVAYLGDRHFYAAGEPIYTRHYTGLVSWRTGCVTVEEILFGQECRRDIVLTIRHGQLCDVTDQVEFVTTGQPLVRGGTATPLEQMAELWYDVRHLLQPIILQLNGATLYLPTAQLQHGLARKALREPVAIEPEASIDADVRVPLTLERWMRLAAEDAAGLTRTMAYLQAQGVLNSDWVAEEAAVYHVACLMQAHLEKALQQARYQVVNTQAPLGEGQARFVNNHLEIYFRKAIYPHNILVTWPDGTAGFVVFPGKSGREGTTLAHAQQFLVETLQVREALLLDNGGDVHLSYRGVPVVGSGEGRAEIRSILALTLPQDAYWDDTVCLA